MNNLIENQGGHGAIRKPVKRWLHRKWRRHVLNKNVARGIPVDYIVGSPFRNLLTGKLPHKNQGINDSCGGQAGSEFLQIQRIIQGINEGELSAKSVYAPIAYQQGGTTIADLQQQIEKRGANLESAVPSYDSAGNPLPEPQMEDKSWMTPALTADARARAGYVSVDIDLNDIDAVAEAIASYGAVIWEIVGKNGNQPLNWTTIMPAPPQASNPNAKWAHFMCAYDFMLYNGQKVIVALQSEGTLWGVNGIQYFGEDYFTNGFIDPFTFEWDGDIPVPVKQPQSEWPALSWFFSGWYAIQKLLGGAIPSIR